MPRRGVTRRGDPRAGRKFCYALIAYEEMDRERIRALRRCIEAERPDWAELVRMATLMEDEVYTIIHLSSIPPYPAVSILENMKERGSCRMYRATLLALAFVVLSVGIFGRAQWGVLVMTAVRSPMPGTSSERRR